MDNLSRIKRLISYNLGINIEGKTLTENTTLESLSFDNLDKIELVLFLEEDFGVEVKNYDPDNFTTIQDFINSIT